MYSTGIAYLLWFFSGFGALGFHRFYLGKIPSGLLWMCSAGLLGFGAFYDFFTLPRQVREANMRDTLLREDLKSREEKQNWRIIRDGESHIIDPKENLERTILKTAKQNKGILTVSGLALEAGISVDDAKKELEALLGKGIAELRVKNSGALVYVFPEFLDPEDSHEDLI